VIKFIYKESTCCVALLNKGQTRIAPTEASGVYSFEKRLICAEYGLETFVVTSGEISLKAFYQKTKLNRR